MIYKLEIKKFWRKIKKRLIKIEAIIYNELKNKFNENYLQKYAEPIFSFKLLENISIIKLIKNGYVDRHKYCDGYWFKLSDKYWTKVNK